MDYQCYQGPWFALLTVQMAHQFLVYQGVYCSANRLPFDEIVPRLIADDEITKEDCIPMGHGGFLG